MSAQYVFTVVHGTWARMPWQRKTDWIQPDKPFANQLREQLNGGVVVIPFEWGGWNNHASRYRASRRLIDQLKGTPDRKGTFDQFPDAKHYIIGHSHGGNVAMYAINGGRFGDEIAGVVSLATPFLIARTRDLGGKTSEHISVLFLVLAILGFAALEMFSFWNSWPALAGAGIRVGAGIVFVLGLMLLTYASSKTATRLRSAMALPDPENLQQDRLLIIRSSGDEASGALGFFQFISQLHVRLFLLFSVMNERVEHWTDSWPKHRGVLALILLGGLAVFMIAAMLSLVLWSRFQNSWMLVPTIGAAIVGLSGCYEAAARFLSPSAAPRLGTFVFRVAAGAVLLPVMIVVSVLLVPFGTGLALASMFLDVTAETTPIGAWTVHQLPPPVAVGATVTLRHRVYANPAAVSTICEWIVEQDRGVESAAVGLSKSRFPLAPA
jgi:hypothetical protein